MLKRLIRNYLSCKGYAVVRQPRPLFAHPTARIDASFDLILCHYLLHQETTPYFVQVGAFNGVDGDPIHAYVRRGLLKGCLIEPQSDAFEKLRLNYSDIDGLTFHRAAIGPRIGTATLYRVKPGTQGPPWLYQIASFNRDVMLRNTYLVPGLENSIIEEQIPTITFEHLQTQLNRTADVVVIDTEGFDYEVVKLLQAANWRPSLILYEHKHLSVADQDSCLEQLIATGYRVAVADEDTTAYLADLASPR